MTASVSWTATYNGRPVGPDPIQMTSQARHIPVAEIQNINSGGYGG